MKKKTHRIVTWLKPFAKLSVLCCILLMSQAFFVHAASVGDEQDYTSLTHVAQVYTQLLIVDDLNRAMAAVEVLHGPQDVRNLGPEQAVQRLRQGGWLSPFLPQDLSDACLRLDGPARFALCHEPAIARPEPGALPRSLWEPGLRDERVAVRWYVLECLAAFPGQGECAGPALDALAREPLPQLLPAYARLLRNPACGQAVQRIRPAQSVEGLLQRLAENPADLEARCLWLYLSTLLTSGPLKADADLILAQLDRGYPVQTLDAALRRLPESVLLELAAELRLGRAQSLGRLAFLLARFPEQGTCLEALVHAFLNRNTPPFESAHRSLVQALEGLTGIPFQGRDQPYLDWYHSHKPQPTPF